MEFQETYTKAHFVEVLQSAHEEQLDVRTKVGEIRLTMDRWRWVLDSRGSYEWDDDRYRLEFGACLDSIESLLSGLIHGTSTSHTLCCDRYAHLRNVECSTIQRSFAFSRTYEEMRDKLMLVATVEGKR